MYADDVLVADNHSEIPKLLDTRVEEIETLKMKINLYKSKVIINKQQL